MSKITDIKLTGRNNVEFNMHTTEKVVAQLLVREGAGKVEVAIVDSSAKLTRAQRYDAELAIEEHLSEPPKPNASMQRNKVAMKFDLSDPVQRRDYRIAINADRLEKALIELKKISFSGNDPAAVDEIIKKYDVERILE